jgi:hypothetical protein
MKIIETSGGYIMRLSANDTWNWAHRPGALWFFSTLANRTVRLDVDGNGLCGLLVDGRGDNVNSDELSACVGDHLPAHLRHLWPCWERKAPCQNATSPLMKTPSP